MANLLRRIFCFRTESATQSVYIQDELNAPYRSNSEKLSGPKLVEQLRADLNRAIEEKETLELRCIQKNKEILDLLKMQVACDIDAMIDEGKLCVTATVTTPRSIERTVISKVGVKLDMASVEPLVSWVTVPRCPYCQQPFGGSDSAKQPFTLVCGHSLCQNCIKDLMTEMQELTRTWNELKCPTCRCNQMVDKVPLPKNFSLLKIVDEMTPARITSL